MKIAIVSPFPEKDIISGGVEGVSKNLIEGLLKLPDVEIYVFAPTSKGASYKEIRGQITIFWIKTSKLPGFIDYWSFYRKRLHKNLYEVQPDITHFQGVTGWSLGYKLPYCMTIHGINENDVMYSKRSFKLLRRMVIRYIEKKSRNKSPYTIIISPYVIEEIGSDLLGAYEILENPIESDFFVDARQEPKPDIVYIGRISHRKNILKMLEVFAKVLEKNSAAKLQIAGNPDNEEYLNICKQYIHKKNMSESVVFRGALNRDEVRAMLLQSSCLILMSKQETAPMVIEESMALSVPVVATGVCGMPYMIEDGETGYLVSDSNINHAASCVLKLIADKKLNRKMGLRANEIAHERFHHDVVAQKTHDIYMKLINPQSFAD